MKKWYQTFSELSQRAQVRVVKLVLGVVVVTTILSAIKVCSADVPRMYWLTAWINDQPVMTRNVLGFENCRRQRFKVLHELDPRIFVDGKVIGTVTVTCAPFDVLTGTET